MPNRIKIAFFYFIVLIPSFILGLVLINVAVNVHRINSGPEYGTIYADVKEYLSSERGEASAVRSGGRLILRYSYADPRNRYRGFEKSVEFSPSGKDLAVYVYGSSPVASKPPFFADRFNNFPEYLEEDLNDGSRGKEFKVYNFSLSSSDSYAIEGTVRETVRLRRPDAIVCYYEGGMDYERMYYIAGIKRQYYPLTVLSLGGLTRTFGLDRYRWWRDLRNHLSWMNSTYLQTDILNFLQAAGILRVDPAPLEAVNEMILGDMRKNVVRVAEMAREEDIPVIFVTSMANLEAKPFGVYDVTQKLYEKGLAEKDYRKKIGYLTEARDSEIFTGDLGGKSEAVDIFRELEGMKNVYVFDLREEMIGEGRGFGYRYFYDYGHMRPELHEIIAGKIYEYMRENDILVTGDG